ncbi:MAG: type II secretion system protein M [Aquificae bacterium]|nr:type II secretion system protein M [Aquificota bacterium]
MIDRINTFLNTLENRERYILLVGIFVTVIIIGVYFITLPLYEKNKKLKEILNREIQNYNELLKLASEYASIKPSVVQHKTISLSEIENLSQLHGIKQNITAIRPIIFEGEKSVEVMIKDAPANKVLDFFTELEKAGYKLKFISIYDPKGDGKLTVRIVIGEQ